MVQIKHLFLFVFIFKITVAQKSDFKQVNFKKADSIASIYEGENLSNLPFLAYHLTHNLFTDIEKFRSIYYWVTHNIKCSIGDAERNLYMRRKYADNPIKLKKWDRSMSKKSFKSLFEGKETLCTGYAYLVRELSVLAGLDCEIVNGYSRSASLNLKKKIIPNHSWNAVFLNHKWYLCDPTWASGYSLTNNRNSTFVFEYDEGYFLTEPSVFIKNHYPENLNWSLIKDVPSLENYILAPLVYKAAYKHSLVPTLPKQMFVDVKVNQEILFSLKYIDKIDVDNINLAVFKGFYYKKIKPKLEIVGNTIRFSNQFTKKGKYDIQIKLGNDVICSYVIKVVK